MPELLGPDVAATDASRVAGVQARVAIVEAAIAVFRQHSLHEATPELVARTAGIPVYDLNNQFPSWNGLILAAIDRWNGQRMHPILPLADSHGTVVFLRGIVQSNVKDPALMRLLAGVLNIAATPGHPMAPMLHSDWRNFHRLVQHHLTLDIAQGREPDTMDPGRGAEQLIALYEGLQLQSMVRPGMDLLDSYDRAVTRLRHGWTMTYVPPTWNIDAT